MSAVSTAVHFHVGNIRLPSLQDLHVDEMRDSFSAFVKEAWKIIEPATPLVWNWHLDAICDHVQALVEGTLGKKNLIMNVPPGSMKTSIVSVCLLPWIWLKRPSYRGCFASGNPRVTSRSSVRCRAILESDWYRDTFHIEWEMSKDQNEKLSYANTKTGLRQATTTNAMVTGERYDGLFVDDPLDAKKALAYTSADVKAVNDWWDTSFWNRIADEATSHRCIIGQRLREDDLCGYVMEKMGVGFWEWLCIPQLWEETQRRTTSLGWTDPRHDDGELMFAQRFPNTFITTETIVLGRSGFEGQHQQRPSLLKGEIFERGFAQFIQRAMIPPATIKTRLMSLDSAIKDKESSDYSVLLTAFTFDRGVFIDMVWRDKCKYTAMKEAVTLKVSAVTPHALLIEDKASGQQLIQEFQLSSVFPVIPVTPTVDKTARARPLTPFWESRRVFFPCDEKGVPEPWVAIFLDELYSFPKGAHDDQVDAFTQLLQYLFLSSTQGRGLMEYYTKMSVKEKEVTEQERKVEAVHHPIDFVKLNGAR